MTLMGKAPGPHAHTERHSSLAPGPGRPGAYLVEGASEQAPRFWSHLQNSDNYIKQFHVK